VQGLRYEYSDYLKRSSLAPRISTACKLGKAGQVSLAYGWFFQDPDDEYLIYSPELEYERADHYTLNYLYEPGSTGCFAPKSISKTIGTW
jgi:vitamin B12 transporter